MEDLEKKHAFYISKAYQLAEQALEENEVPIGAVVVYDDMIIGKGYNQTERLKDATAHAEMIAITAAAEYLNSKYLKDCTLYVTMEPCVMCGGAIQWSQIDKIVYGASDPQKGCFSRDMNLLPKKTKITSGVLAEKCGDIVRTFFQDKRDQKLL